jgi:hypothetical protein
MNDKQFNDMCEKKLAKKAQAREIITRYGAVRMDWVCECGSNLKWNSDYHQHQHKQSRKHKNYLSKHLGE